LGAFEFRYLDRRCCDRGGLFTVSRIFLPHEKRRTVQQNSEIEAGGDAEGPGIALTAILSGTGIGFEVSSRRRQLGREEDIAGCSGRDQPKWACLNRKPKVRSEFAAVHNGRGSFGFSVWLDEQIVGHRCVWFRSLLTPGFGYERKFSVSGATLPIMLDATRLCLAGNGLKIQTPHIFGSARASHKQ